MTSTEAALCLDLAAAVTTTQEPCCPAAQRQKCYEVIERFKEESPHCLECGFRLAGDTSLGPAIQHFGLQLLEHFVRYRWSSINLAEQKLFAERLLDFLLSVLSSDEKPNYVKESLARITVETAKRLWPQHWPSFISDLGKLLVNGPSHVMTELVLLVYRRLAEDVHCFEAGLTSQRRREMTSALNEHIDTVVSFLLANITAPPSDRLRWTAVSALTSYAEWVDFKTLLAQDCQLLRLLYSCLGVGELRRPAVECLMVILARKGDLKRTAEERMKLLMLMSQDALSGVAEAAKLACGAEVVDEDYVFLKRLCQVLVHLGVSQLAPLWRSAEFSRPEGFGQYLELVLQFTSHPSQLLSLTSLEVWSVFVGHGFIREDEVFHAFLPRLLTAARQRLVKEGDPAHSGGGASSAFNRVDFDGPDEFYDFFSRFRGAVRQLVSHVCALMPAAAGEDALSLAQWLVQQKQEGDCSKSSALFLHWDALVCYLECWAGVAARDDLDPASRQLGLAIVSLLLSHETSEPLLLHCQFRCLKSKLLTLLSLDHHLLEKTLQKIFGCVALLKGGHNAHKDVTSARNLVVSCFVSIAELHGNLLLPSLRHLHEQYLALVRSDVLLSADKCVFIEAFIVLGQLQPVLQDRVSFIGAVLDEVHALSRQLQPVIQSLEELVKFLGLGSSPADPGYSIGHRASLSFVVHVTTSLLKKSQPAQPHLSSTYLHTMPLVTAFILPLVSSLYQLWSERSRPLLSEYFSDFHQFHPAEAMAIMGSSMANRGDLEATENRQIQLNLNTVNESCLQCVGLMFIKYGYQSMLELSFVDALLAAVFTHAAELNSWKLRPICRHLVMPLVGSCPEQCWASVLLPILSQALHVMFNKLRAGWEAIAARSQSSNGQAVVVLTGGREVTREILDEHVTIALSKEYTHLLEVVCVKRLEGAKKKQTRMEGEDVAMEAEEESQAASHYSTASALATQLLLVPEMSELLFLSAFSGVAWRHTQSSSRCTTVSSILFEEVPINYFSGEVYGQLFTQVLVGLQTHGAHEQNRSELCQLALQMYQSAGDRLSSVTAILLQVPGITEQRLKSFNHQLKKKGKNAPTRHMKEMFRELLSGIIGKPLGEAFRRQSAIFDLPEVVFRKKMACEDEEAIVDLTSLFK